MRSRYTQRIRHGRKAADPQPQRAPPAASFPKTCREIRPVALQWQRKTGAASAPLPNKLSHRGESAEKSVNPAAGLTLAPVTEPHPRCSPFIARSVLIRTSSGSTPPRGRRGGAAGEKIEADFGDRSEIRLISDSSRTSALAAAPLTTREVSRRHPPVNGGREARSSPPPFVARLSTEHSRQICK